MRRRDQAGWSLIELLVSVTILLVIMTGVTQLMLQNSRINRAQQMTAMVQANARNSLSMIVQRLRSAGWDPMNVGIETVTVDPDLSDDVSEIEVFADLDEDGLTNGIDEQVLIRHAGDRIVWRRTNDVDAAFVVLATNITNDADGDGAVEAMFMPDPATNPARVTVRITAQSPVPDPMSGEYIRYTVSSAVVLRKSL